MSRAIRALITVLLLTALGGLFVHYEATEDARARYPEPDELAADYDGYVGDTVLVFGRVTAVGDDALTIEAESEGVTVELRVRGSSAAVSPGGFLQVYGQLRPERTLTAQRVVVVNDNSGAEWYKYGVSLLGAIGFLLAFARHWRIDTETLTVEARDG